MSTIFMKIKIDSGNSGNKNGEFSFHEFTENITFREVKERIEDYVNIPADEQTIKTISRIFQDNEKLNSLIELERKEGTALQLDDQNSKFVCFLQLYNEKEAAFQRQYEEKSKRPSFYKNLSSTSTITLTADSDNEDLDESSDSTETSSSSSDSDDEVEAEKNSNVGLTKKRKMEENIENVEKKKCYEPMFKGHISQYLDDLQTNPDATISSSTSTTAQTKSTLEIDVPRKVVETSKKPSVDTVCTVVHSTVKATAKIPCAGIAPEYRKFIAIANIQSGEKDLQKCQHFLEDCFIKFQETNLASSLLFDDDLPIALHSDGTIWIACKDDNTLSWVLENIKGLANVNCAVEKFFNQKHFKACTVVIPGFQGKASRSLQDIFNLLEVQNAGLNTAQWVVCKKRAISNENDEFFERKISRLCLNEILFFYINKESEDYLKRNNFQLKYCFWNLSVYLKEDNSTN